jgi:arsenate reductase
VTSSAPSAAVTAPPAAVAEPDRMPAPLPRRVVTDARPSVLFACRANAGRSVTARVLAERYAAGRFDVHSAGSEPASAIHANVAAVLTGLGLDVSAETPKPFNPDARYTVVVTMGCGDTCPYYAGARYEDWPIDDPKGQDPDTVRRIVADIDTRVRDLLTELDPAAALPAHVTSPLPR